MTIKLSASYHTIGIPKYAEAGRWAGTTSCEYLLALLQHTVTQCKALYSFATTLLILLCNQLSVTLARYSSMQDQLGDSRSTVRGTWEILLEKLNWTGLRLEAGVI